jgi:hypothetical protein
MKICRVYIGRLLELSIGLGTASNYGGEYEVVGSAEPKTRCMTHEGSGRVVSESGLVANRSANVKPHDLREWDPAVMDEQGWRDKSED